MIEILKSEIEQKLGCSIKHRGECQFLSDAILVEFGETLNYNTIRRFFGVDKRSEIAPSHNTLDILSRFLGYNSYYGFCKKVSSIGTGEYQEEWYFIFHLNDADQIISYFIKKRRKNISFIDFFVKAIRELLLFGRIDTIDKVYRCSELKLAELSYSESVFIGNAIGILLRDVNLSDEDYLFLLKNKSFVRDVFSIFVDYSSLNKGYGSVVALAQVNNATFSKNDVQFFRCLNYFREFLLRKKLAIQSNCDFATFEAHPILIGRIAAIELLKHRNLPIERKAIFEKLKERYQSEKVRRIDYFYEVNIIAITLSDFELMGWLEAIHKEPQIQQYYQISHYQAGYLTDLLLSIYEKDEEKQRYFLSKINPDLWVKSYSDFFNLFYLVALFYCSPTTKKKEFKNDYLLLIEQLNYPFFDEEFLVTYFN
jgi:hypothetical protein